MRKVVLLNNPIGTHWSRNRVQLFNTTEKKYIFFASILSIMKVVSFLKTNIFQPSFKVCSSLILINLFILVKYIVFYSNYSTNPLVWSTFSFFFFFSVYHPVLFFPLSDTQLRAGGDEYNREPCISNEWQQWEDPAYRGWWSLVRWQGSV